MSFVTVPGGNGVTIAVPFTSGQNVAVATQLLANLYYADPKSLNQVDASAPTNQQGAISGDINEYIDNISGQVAVPRGYQYLIGDFVTGASSPYPANSFIASGTLDGAVINASPTSLSYTAGTGNVTIVAGGGLAANQFVMNTLITAGGSGQLDLDGPGREVISLASGTWSVNGGTGLGNTFTLGSGADTVNVNGNNNIVQAGTGPSFVVFGGPAETGLSGDVFKGTFADASVSDYGSNDTIYAGSGFMTVFGNGHNLHITGGGGEITFVDNTGGNTFSAGAGGAVAFSGTKGSSYVTGSNYFYLINGGGRDTITTAANELPPIVFGSINPAVGGEVFVNSAAPGAFVVGGTGNQTFNASGSKGRVVFFAGTGNTDMIGAPGQSNFYGANTGNSTMSGGLGNLYEFINHYAGGTDIITDFTSSDELYLANYGTSANSGIATEIVLNGQLNLTLTDGTKIIFQNLNNPAQLNGHIFHI